MVQYTKVEDVASGVQSHKNYNKNNINHLPYRFTL